MDISEKIVIEHKFDDAGNFIKIDWNEVIEGFVDPELLIWEQKDEFEKTEAYLKRISDEKREIKFQLLSKKTIADLGNKLVNFNTAVLGKYDADKESFTMTIPESQVIVFPVSIHEAISFKEHWPDVQFKNPEYDLINDQIVVSRFDILLNGKTWYYGTEQTTSFAPVIVITYPIIFDKKAKTYKKELPLAGKIRSRKPIKKLLVNDVEISVSPKKTFEANLTLDYGENQLVIIAIDDDDRVSKKIIIVERIEPIDLKSSTETMASKRLNHALIISGNHYDHWSDLTNPVFDAKSIAEELQNIYGFQTEVVEDATFVHIISKLREYAEKSYEPNDALFIFFAGHGQFDNVFKEGYVVARDSRENDETKTTYISHSNLRTIINNIPCEHIFLVMDVCFGGTFDPWLSSSARGGAEYKGISKSEFIKRKLKYKTRMYMTSGGKEYVPDGRPGHHSPFARKFLEALRSYGGKDGVLTINEIITYIEKVQPQPRIGEFGDNEPGSDFIFIAK